MILELRAFYHAKFEAFRKCVQPFTELCDAVYQLTAELDKKIQIIYDHAQSLKDTLPDNTLFHVRNFADDINLETLYTAKEMIGIGCTICPLYQKMKPPIDLSKFTDKVHIC